MAMATELEEARRRMRLLGMPRFREVTSDTARSGRVGDDFSADDRLLFLDSYSRQKLIDLLRDSVLEHRWADASGICATLLRSLSLWSKGHRDIKHFYTTALQILNHVEPGEDNHTMFRKLFNFMYTHQPMSKQTESKRLQGEAELLLAIYLLSVQDWENAYNILRTIADGALHDDPTVNLTYGQVLHHLWSELVRKEAGVDESSDGIGSFGDWQPETKSIDKANPIQQALIVRDARDESQAASENSAFDAVDMHSTLQPSNRKRKRSEIDEDDDFWANAMVEVRPIMDRRLFAAEIPHNRPNAEYVISLTPRMKEFFDKAIEHLQRALASAPEMIPALISLVQLLLAAGDVEGANKEIEICHQATKHIVPLYLQSLLLESLTEKDSDRAAQCYEQILFHNPASLDAVTGLISLHEKGEYPTESLVESLANHLDGEPGSVRVWRKLADCFLEISLNIKNEDGRDISAEDLVLIFVDRSWWIVKHFPDNLIAADTSASRWKMVTYKAACAAHIFGSSFTFVTKAAYVLKELNRQRFLARLTIHRERSLNLLG